MRYSSLFSNHWQLGGQNWQDASSTKKYMYFGMFYWTRYRCHGNTAGKNPALNNGFDLFSENPVVRFFPSSVSRISENYWPIDTGLVKFWQKDLRLFCVLHFNVFSTCPLSYFNFCLQAVARVLYYYPTKFHEFLRSGSIEISAFPLNRAVTILWLTVDRVRSCSIPTNNPRKVGHFPIAFPLIH